MRVPTFSAWQRRPGLLRARDQLPEVALADRHHPGIRTGAREFLRPVEPVHRADAVLALGLAELRLEHPERPAHGVHRHADMGQDARASLAAPAKVVEAGCL